MRFFLITRFFVCAFIVFVVGCAHQPLEYKKDKARGEVTHIVTKGDTLFSVAKQYGVSTDDIMKANGLGKNTSLTLGQPLLIPGAKTKSQAKPSGSVAQRPSDESKKIDLGWPVVKGVVFRTFDQTGTRLHEGLSIGAPANTPIRAAQDGQVIYAAEATNHLGRMVLIQHADPFVSIYGHLEDIKVKVGQRVKKGDVIGTVGTSGSVESPRVYFELRKDRLPVNPEPYLPKG